MPFGRLHEEAAGDSKLLALSDAAWRMWGMGLIYCQKNLTDGFIPTHAIATFGVRGVDVDALLDRVLKSASVPAKAKAAIEAAIRSFISTPRSVASELCAPQVPGKAALWQMVDGGYQVHDYLHWNDSKEQILKSRAEGRDRIKRWREEHKLQQQVQQGEQTSVRNTEQNTERNALHQPVRDAHASGTWLVGSSEEGSGEKPPAERRRVPTRRQGDGAMGHESHRYHLNHAFCGPNFTWCVPSAVHAKLVGKLAPAFKGDRAAAALRLESWYPTVWASLPADFVMPDEFKFFEGRFDQDFASKAPSNGRPHEIVSTVPSAAETAAKYLR